MGGWPAKRQLPPGATEIRSLSRLAKSPSPIFPIVLALA